MGNVIITEKTCRGCGKTLPIEAFAPNVHAKDGHQNYCRECMAERIKKGHDEKVGSLKKSKIFSLPEPKPVNPDLAKFKARELIEELRNRGYRGTLEFTYNVTL